MPKFDENFLYGYAQVAQLLHTTPGALAVATNRGRCPLKPVFHIGRTAVFDHAEVLRYAQERERAKQRRGQQ